MFVKVLLFKVDCVMDNVEFIEFCIINIVLEDGIVDCIIFNCVVNLVLYDEK